MWDLKNEKIFFGLKLAVKKSVKKHEQLFISYGDRANSFLLVEYGFALPYNRFDFYRVDNVTLKTFFDKEEPFF